ncbi:MAG: hypothetical protein KGI02_10330 [Thaumarchaeota archaeon]|nr:hypothetical protein [Nitrososphaerota archaeon]
MKGDLKLNNKSNVTLSIDTAIFNEIKKDSKNQTISVNTKINTILAKHVLFYKHLEDQEGASIPRKYFEAFIELLDENKHIELLTNVSVETMQAVYVHDNIPFTLDGLIKHHFEKVALWAGAYRRFRHYVDEEGYTCLVFDHKLGIKWSRILGASICNMIREMANQTSTFKVLSTAVLVKVDKK